MGRSTCGIVKAKCAVCRAHVSDCTCAAGMLWAVNPLYLLPTFHILSRQTSIPGPELIRRHSYVATLAPYGTISSLALRHPSLGTKVCKWILIHAYESFHKPIPWCSGTVTGFGSAIAPLQGDDRRVGPIRSVRNKVELDCIGMSSISEESRDKPNGCS